MQQTYATDHFGLLRKNIVNILRTPPAKQAEEHKTIEAIPDSLQIYLVKFKAEPVNFFIVIPGNGALVLRLQLAQDRHNRLLQAFPLLFDYFLIMRTAIL
jgi:hypothetical protein